MHAQAVFSVKTHSPSALTETFGQQIANKFIVVSHVEDAVDTWGHQLLLGVSKVTRHVLRNKDDAALPVDDEEKPIKGLNEQEKEQENQTVCVELGVKMKKTRCVCVCDCVCIVHL